MRVMRLERRAVATVLIAGLLTVAVACNGGDSPEAPTPETASNFPSTAEPTQDPVANTGLSIGEISVDGREFGGNVTVEVSNTADTLCAGLVVNFNLLTEDGKIVGKIGVNGSPLEPDSSQTLKTRYIGAGVTTALISAITCHSSSLGDAGAPDRAHTPEPESK